MVDETGRVGHSPHHSAHQTVLNEAWPLRDRDGRHARGIPDQPHPIDVDVRLELATDGEQWLPGRAQRWTRTHVYVTALNDARVRPPGVWVLAADVRRRGLSQNPVSED